MDDYIVTVTEKSTGLALTTEVVARVHTHAGFTASQVPVSEWIPAPPTPPIELFTLQTFDHGVEVDSVWSSLELAQLAAVTTTTEYADGENYGKNPESDAVKASVVWEHDDSNAESARHWRATSPDDVGFVITRAVLDQPRQF